MIIFESHLYPDSIIDMLKKKSNVGLDYAAHNFSNAIYKGLILNEQEIKLVNSPNIGSFPVRSRTLRVPKVNLTHGFSIPFWNITYFKRKNIQRNVYKYICRYLLEDISRKPVLLVYNFKENTFFKKLKEQWPNLKICMIVTDLPEFMNRPQFISYHNDRKSRVPNNSRYSFPDVDGFVFLAPQMSERINTNNKPWMVMEGIYDSEDIGVNNSERRDLKIILYTGNLNRKYGIAELLDAFDRIKSDEYRLWLRGDGECKELVCKRMAKDKRIVLLDCLSRKELLTLQKNATILINPVRPSEEFTNYFFPSKTLEYLASGTPLLMYHLSCIPKEYDEHIYFIEEESVDGIRKKIEEVCNKPEVELRAFGESASTFIMEKKTPKVQIDKIISFVKSL